MLKRVPIVAILSSSMPLCACSDPPSATALADTDVPYDAYIDYDTGTAPIDSGTSVVDTGPPSKGTITLPFTVTNIGPTALTLPYDGDVWFSKASGCTSFRIDTTAGKIECYYGGWIDYSRNYRSIPQAGTLPDGSPPPPLGVFTARSFHFGEGVYIEVIGRHALVLLAQQEIVVEGTLALNGRGSAGGPGGYAWVDPAAGPGKGGFVSKGMSGGGGGAGHCTAGGKGSSGGAAGAAYGTDAIVPLVGGSSGGATSWFGGGGGGAIQLVAGTSVTIAETAKVHAGGGGGYRKCISGGGGGGSGGAILIEAPTVNIRGVLAANGGAGGSAMCTSGSTNTDATPDDLPAWDGDLGGKGAAGSAPPTSGGTPTVSADGPGGGGGAAGRIRLNGATVSVSVGAIVSPAVGSCASKGTLSAPGKPPPDAGLSCDVFKSPKTACQVCSEDACCEASKACLGSTVCAYCLEAPDAPACKTNTAYTTLLGCRATNCKMCP